MNWADVEAKNTRSEAELTTTKNKNEMREETKVPFSPMPLTPLTRCGGRCGPNLNVNWCS